MRVGEGGGWGKGASANIDDAIEGETRSKNRELGRRFKFRFILLHRICPLFKLRSFDRANSSSTYFSVNSSLIDRLITHTYTQQNIYIYIYNSVYMKDDSGHRANVRVHSRAIKLRLLFGV